MDVLLVDDEEVIHDTLGTYLSGCGMKVEAQSAGASAFLTKPFQLRQVRELVLNLTS